MLCVTVYVGSYERPALREEDMSAMSLEYHGSGRMRPRSRKSLAHYGRMTLVVLQFFALAVFMIGLAGYGLIERAFEKKPQ